MANQAGIYVFNECDCLFDNNASATITNNLIINNGYAGILLVNARDLDIHDNVVTSNLNGIVTQTRVSGGAHNNDIYGNTNNNAILNGTLSTSMFNNNWWGANPTLIPEVPGVNWHCRFIGISGSIRWWSSYIACFNTSSLGLLCRKDQRKPE